MPILHSLSTAVLMFLLLPLSLTTTITHVQAQATPPSPTLIPAPPPPTTEPYSPTPFYNAHSVFVEGDALYVHGGLFNIASPPQPQLFVLDLSVSWKTNQPAFKKRLPGFPSAGVTSALMKDRDTWMMFDGNKYVFYSIKSETWSQIVMNLELNPKSPGFPAVTDVLSDLVYVVNGAIEPSMSATAVGTIPMMLTYKRDGTNQMFGKLGASSGFSLVESGFAGCWSTVRESILLHGGLTGSPVAIYQKTMFEYNTTTHGFTAASDKGESPTARAGHCMVEAYNGTKIVLFGGVDSTSSGLADIFILDVATMVWTPGKTGGAGVGRAYAACAVTNDRFVALGGATRVDGNFVAVPTTNPIVYDFIQDKWITTFSPLRTNPSSPDPDPLIPPPTPPTGEDSSSSSSSSKGALIGGIAGGVAVAAAIAAFIFFRRRRTLNKKQKQEQKMSFSTIAAMPVVATRSDSFSDDSLPDQQQQNRKNTQEIGKREDDDRKEDEDERRKKRGNPKDDGSGVVTYVVEARAMPSSPTESSFRDSRIIPQNHAYQQLQQQPLQPLPEQQHAYSSASRVPYPVPPATAAANGSTGYSVPVLKFFNPTATIPTTPASNTDTTSPISIPSSPVASISPLPLPSTPQRPQSLIPGGFAIPHVIHSPSSSQPQEPIKNIDPSFTTLIPYASPVASVYSVPPQSILPVLNNKNNKNNNTQAYTNDHYHDQERQGKEEAHCHQQHPRPAPTVEYGPNSSPALSYLACSSQLTSSLGSTLGVAPPPTPGAPGTAGPYSTFSPSPLSAAPTTASPVLTAGGSGGNTYTTFSPSPLSWYSDSTEARNSLPFAPVVITGKGTPGDPHKIRDEVLVPPVTLPRNPHGSFDNTPHVP